MTRMKSYSVTWLAPAMLIIASADPLTAQLERAPTTRPTIYVAGPAWLTAAGYIPTKIMLKWKEVPNAKSYMISRWSDIERRHPTGELPAVSTTMKWNYDMEGGSYFIVDGPVDMTSTYSYDIQAVFIDANGAKTYSNPSPTASAKSAPFVAPSNFKYTFALYTTPGKLRLTFTWDPVANAQEYAVFFLPTHGRTPGISDRTSKTTTLVVDDVFPYAQYDVCIFTIYEPLIRDNRVRACIPVKFR